MKTKLNEFKSFLRKEIKAAITEVESKYADSFELDQAKGGTDTSMDKMQKELLKLQKEMNKLFVDYKAGRLDAKTYAMKRKPLQAKRNKLEADLLSIEESKVRQAVRGMIGKLFEAEKKEEAPKQEDNDLESISTQVTSWYNSNKKKLEKLADEEDWDEFYEMGFNKFPDADQDDVAQAMNKAAMASGLFEAEEVAEMPTEKELEDKAFGDKKLQKGVKMGDYDKKNKLPKASPTELKPEELKKLKTESKKKINEAYKVGDKIHIGTDTKTDSDIFFDPKTGTFSINVIDASGNRTNKLQVNTIDDVLAKFKSNWKWTEAGKDEFADALDEVYVPNNIETFAKQKGVLPLVKKVAGWAERVGKRINGGTAIGKNYSTLVLDMGHQTSDIYINIDNGTIKLYGEEVSSLPEFKKVYNERNKKNEVIEEAEYRGRKVTLNKPFYTPGGPRKRAVYVKNDKGNIVKVGFGDPNMKIKKNIPGRRKSFRARHHCDTNPGPRWKARYWSCKAW